MRLNKAQYTAGLLLLLYIGYYSCVSLFTHSHVYNGITYVHSHPFNKDDSKKGSEKEHSHSSSALFLLNQLSSITTSNLDLFTHFEAIPCKVYAILYNDRTDRLIIDKCPNSVLLRAPPSRS